VAGRVLGYSLSIFSVPGEEYQNFFAPLFKNLSISQSHENNLFHYIIVKFQPFQLVTTRHYATAKPTFDQIRERVLKVVQAYDKVSAEKVLIAQSEFF
jgi:hypothetical protein